MKRLLLFSLFLLLSGIGFAETFESNARVEFQNGSVNKLSIFNKSGRIEVDRKAGSHGVIVKASIICNAKNETEAKNVFAKIGIKQTNSGGSASVYTEIDNIKKVRNFLSGIDYSVNYTVILPWGIDLNIVNEKGSVLIPDYSDRLNLQTKNCNVMVGNVTGEEISQIVMKGGSLVMKDAENMKLDLHSCSYEIGNVFNLEFKANGAKGSINSATLISCSLMNADVNMKTTEDFSGSAEDSHVVIDDLGDCLSFDLTRGSLDVRKVHLSFDKILLNSVWGNVSMAFMSGSGFDISLQHDRRLKVNLPAGFRLTPLNSSSKNIKIGIGHYGAPERKGEVNMKLMGGMLNII